MTIKLVGTFQVVIKGQYLNFVAFGIRDEEAAVIEYGNVPWLTQKSLYTDTYSQTVSEDFYQKLYFSITDSTHLDPRFIK